MRSDVRQAGLHHVTPGGSWVTFFRMLMHNFDLEPQDVTDPVLMKPPQGLEGLPRPLTGPNGPQKPPSKPQSSGSQRSPQPGAPLNPMPLPDTRFALSELLRPVPRV